MNRKYKYDNRNPLFLYYEKLAEKNKGKNLNNWLELADLTGLPEQTIISISRNDYEAILRMTLRTYLTLKRTIKVDMLAFGKENE